MVVVGYHASHEQHGPADLLRHVRHAEAVGFAAGWSSDHLTPWSHAQGQSGFAWTWLGAAVQATDLPFGIVTSPGQRYHPVVVAQALATLGALAPGRIVAALGSGEASNEHVTGDRWPAKPERHARLLECVEAIRSLLHGDEVTVHGHVRIDRAKLWTLPPQPVPLYGASLCEATARWCGRWADGLITVDLPPEQLRRVIGAFREGGGEGRPVAVQAKVAWADTEDAALQAAHEQWRTNVFDSVLMADLETVEQFETAARHVRPEDVRSSVFVSADLGRHVENLRSILDCGVDALYLHHVPKPQEAFIDAFAADVLPELEGLT